MGMTKRDDRDGGDFFEAVEAAIAYGGAYGSQPKSEAFNIVADHVADLLAQAIHAYADGSFGTATFLAITALEETTKAEIIGYRKPQSADGSKRGRDPLRDHVKKHIIAVRPTVFMSDLPKILGEDACNRLRDEAGNGELARLRERAIYTHADPSGVSAPRTVISLERAREILLLALEAADDVLVGYTNHSFALGERFRAWFTQVAAR